LSNCSIPTTAPLSVHGARSALTLVISLSIIIERVFRYWYRKNDLSNSSAFSVGGPETGHEQSPDRERDTGLAQGQTQYRGQLFASTSLQAKGLEAGQ
jgi:hypothetical protein